MEDDGQNGRKSAALALLGGICVVLGYPPFSFFPPLLILGPTLLFVALRGAGWRRAMLCGALFGGSIQAGGFPWLAGTVARFYSIVPGGENGPTASEAFWIGILAFSVWLLVSTFAWVLYAVLIARGPARAPLSLAWAALLWMAIEAFYPRIFPWALGAGFSQSEWWAQGAWWVGVSGLSGLIIFSAGLLAEGWSHWRRGRSPWRWWGVAMGGIALGTLLGAVRFAGEIEGPSDKFRVGYVQAAISLERRHSYDQAVQFEVLDEIADRTRELAQSEHPALVIWSEGMLPGVWLPEKVAFWMRTRVRVPMVVGGLGAEGDSVTNRAFISLDTNADSFHSYSKRALVLFGERIPGRGLLRRIGIPIPAAVIDAGTEVLVVDCGGVPIAPSICFEGILPGTAFDLRDRGARLHLNLTEDLWYGDSAAPYQHLALTRMRAVEAGLPLVRVTNGGITAACDARGRWIDHIPLGGPVAGVFELDVPRELQRAPLTQEVFR